MHSIRSYAANTSPVTFSYTFKLIVFFTYVEGKNSFHFFRPLFRGKIKDGRHQSPGLIIAITLAIDVIENLNSESFYMC